MFEYLYEKELVEHLIKNQEKYFKEKYDCKIISGNTIFSYYVGKNCETVYRACDMIGLSDDKIYIIEVKRDKVGIKTIQDYARPSEFLSWSLKEIVYLFIYCSEYK